MDNIKIELHLIQNFAPSCLNRDVTNTPKDCEFGGTRRARISSQCMKRSVRKGPGTEFARLMERAGAKRTRGLAREIARRITGSDEPEKKTLDAVIDIFQACGLEEDAKRKGEGVSSILVFLDASAIDDMAAVVSEALPELTGKDKVVKEDTTSKLAGILAGAVRAPDIALFGRMLEVKESTPFGKAQMNVDAAAQVAHAISTHRVDMDFDYFSAVDDLPGSDKGAAHINETGFNSACFYRYAVIDRGQLVKNLGDEKLADEVIRAFIEASVEAIPSGKQSSFAAHNKPDFGMIVVRKNGAPCSLANAFAKPVRVKPGVDEDLVGLSIESLCALQPRIKDVYGDGGIVNESLWHLGHEDRLGELKPADKKSFAAAVDSAMAAVARAASEA